MFRTGLCPGKSISSIVPGAIGPCLGFSITSTMSGSTTYEPDDVDLIEGLVDGGVGWNGPRAMFSRLYGEGLSRRYIDTWSLLRSGDTAPRGEELEVFEEYVDFDDAVGADDLPGAGPFLSSFSARWIVRFVMSVVSSSCIGLSDCSCSC